jgi:hypothetical protein
MESTHTAGWNPKQHLEMGRRAGVGQLEGALSDVFCRRCQEVAEKRSPQGERPHTAHQIRGALSKSVKMRR